MEVHNIFALKTHLNRHHYRLAFIQSRLYNSGVKREYRGGPPIALCQSGMHNSSYCRPIRPGRLLPSLPCKSHLNGRLHGRRTQSIITHH